MRLSLLKSFVICLLATSPGNGDCHFPSRWAGEWFQSGVPHMITVNTTAFETKGRCVEMDGDKFIIEDRQERCYRCVVIHEKHANVLQYKETFCDRRDSLSNLCGQITGDAILYSMFRSGAAPSTCPFSGGPPFTFTYNRGSGECAAPVSRVDPCTDASRLLLRYQACPDVEGTESAVEELVCLAHWKDGSTRYLVGRLQHAMAHSDEDRYRCFVYERSAGAGRRAAYNVAQSGDATCNGLLSATEGSRTMRLTKLEREPQKCRYPWWVTEHHQWLTLDHRRAFHFSQKNATMRVEAPDRDLRAVCHTVQHADERHERLVAHATAGCQNGYMCIVFYRRDGHVMELQQSNTWTRTSEEACQPHNFNPATLPFITLITPSLRPRQCPYLGRYLVTGPPTACAQQQSLAVGCNDKLDTMEFNTPCTSPQEILSYSCHGSWEDNGTSYLIASPTSRKSMGAHRYCFIYTDIAGSDSLQVASVTETCHRNIPPTAAEWAFNLTAYEQCADSSSPQIHASVVLILIVLLMTSR